MGGEPLSDADEGTESRGHSVGDGLREVAELEQWMDAGRGKSLLVIAGSPYERRGMTQVLVRDDGRVRLCTVGPRGAARDEVIIDAGEALRIVRMAAEILRTNSVLRPGALRARSCEPTYMFSLLANRSLEGGFFRFAREVEATPEICCLWDAVRALPRLVSGRNHTL